MKKSDNLDEEKKSNRTTIIGAVFALILIIGAVWYSQIVSYESSLGTDNVVKVSIDDANHSNGSNDNLLSMQFEDGGENLSWGSLEISLKNGDAEHSCTFGVQSNDNNQEGKIVSTLGADAKTFTAVIDATSEDEFTALNLPEMNETNLTDYWMKFSKTDVYLGDGISWKFYSNVDFDQIKNVNTSDFSNNTDDRLDWYEYDFSVHRVIPLDGVYVIKKGDSLFKLQFLSYYNSDDESRYPTVMIAAVDDTDFPALDNPNLVVPSPCKITVNDLDVDNWNYNETVFLVENNVNICSSECDLEIVIRYEKQKVAVD